MIEATSSVEADAAIEADGVVGHGPGEEADRLCARGREAEAVEVGLGERLRRRERVREAERVEPGHRRAEPLDEPPRERARAGDASPAGRRSRARPSRTGPGAGRPERRAGLRAAARRAGRRRAVARLVEVEVEAGDAAGPLHHVHELVPVRQVGAQQQVVVAARDSSSTPGSPSMTTVRR